LIDDALSARPRPGLFDFLAFCLERFERVALFGRRSRWSGWQAEHLLP
jgi:hypothetical protein